MWTEAEHFKAVVRPGGRHHPRRQDGRARRRDTSRVHGGRDTAKARSRCGSEANTARSSENERLHLHRVHVRRDTGHVFVTRGSRWRPEEHPMTTGVRVEIEDVGGRTKMRMTHTAFPAAHQVPPVGDGTRQASRPGESPHRPIAAMLVDQLSRAGAGQAARRSRPQDLVHRLSLGKLVDQLVEVADLLHQWVVESSTRTPRPTPVINVAFALRCASAKYFSHVGASASARPTPTRRSR